MSSILLINIKIVKVNELFIIHSMFIFKEDNVFSMTANLPYDPPVNIDIDYHRNFSDFF